MNQVTCKFHDSREIDQSSQKVSEETDFNFMSSFLWRSFWKTTKWLFNIFARLTESEWSDQPAVQVYPSRCWRVSCRVTLSVSRSSSLMVKSSSTGAVICFRPQEDRSVLINDSIGFTGQYSLWTGCPQWVHWAPSWPGGPPWTAWSGPVRPQPHKVLKTSDRNETVKGIYATVLNNIK